MEGGDRVRRTEIVVVHSVKLLAHTIFDVNDAILLLGNWEKKAEGWESRKSANIILLKNDVLTVPVYIVGSTVVDLSEELTLTVDKLVSR